MDMLIIDRNSTPAGLLLRLLSLPWASPTVIQIKLFQSFVADHRCLICQEVDKRLFRLSSFRALWMSIDAVLLPRSG